MALNTRNIYGMISVADDAVLLVVKKVALDCYGVTELVSHRFFDSVLTLINRDPVGRGIKIITEDNRIYIDIYCVIAREVNVDAVVDSLKSALQYHVEYFTGMRVKRVNVHVMGMKL